MKPRICEPAHQILGPVECFIRHLVSLRFCHGRGHVAGLSRRACDYMQILTNALPLHACKFTRPANLQNLRMHSFLYKHANPQICKSVNSASVHARRFADSATLQIRRSAYLQICEFRKCLCKIADAGICGFTLLQILRICKSWIPQICTTLRTCESANLRIRELYKYADPQDCNFR